MVDMKGLRDSFGLVVKKYKKNNIWGVCDWRKF